MKYSKQIRVLNVYSEFCKAYENGNISQAYLFISPDRLTNKHLLLELARKLNCNEDENCSCANCAKIEMETHPDVLVYPKTSNFAVESANEIYDNIQVKPMYSNYKVFIINDLDISTEQAQNKMLKIIEEPPKNVVFLISAVSENKILQTIKSRVQKKYVDKIDLSILGCLFENSDKKQMALENGDGYLGKTINFIDNNEFFKSYESMKNLLINFKRSEQIPHFSSFFSSNKNSFEQNLLILNEFFRDLLITSLGLPNLVKNKSLMTNFNELIGEYSPVAINNILKQFNEVKKKLERNVNLVFLADNMLMNILEVKFLCK